MISQTTAAGYAHHARVSEDITNTGALEPFLHLLSSGASLAFFTITHGGTCYANVIKLSVEAQLYFGI